MHTDILKFALASTSDPVVAAQLADRLGAEAIDTPPRVAFPPEWVWKKRKGSQRLAAYAVRHCDDLGTLRAIATSGVSSVVMTRALAEHPLYDSLGVVVQAPSKLAEGDKLQALRQEIDQQLAKVTNVQDYHFRDLLSILARASTPPSEVDRALQHSLLRVKKAGRANPATVVWHFVASRAGLEGSDLAWRAWSKATLKPGAMLEALGPKVYPTLVMLLVQSSMTGEARAAGEGLIDEELLEVIMRLYQAPGGFDFSRVGWPSSRRLFSDKAVEMLLESSWRNWLVWHAMTDAELARLLEYFEAGSPELATALSWLPRRRSALGLLLAKMGSNDFFDKYYESTLTRLVASLRLSSGDELLDGLLSHCLAPQVLSYLCGGWNVDGVVVLPSADDVAKWGEQCRGVEERYQSGWFSSLAKVIGEADHAYLRQVIEFVPGAWRHFLGDERVRDELFVELTSLGASLDMVLDQLDQAPNTTTLSELRRAIGALARLSA